MMQVYLRVSLRLNPKAFMYYRDCTDTRPLRRGCPLLTISVAYNISTTNQVFLKHEVARRECYAISRSESNQILHIVLHCYDYLVVSAAKIEDFARNTGGMNRLRQGLFKLPALLA